MKKFVYLFYFTLFFPMIACSEMTVGIPEDFWVTYTSQDAKVMEVFVQEFREGQWETPIRLTNALDYNLSPCIALMPDGSLWAAWSSFDGKSTSIYARHYHNGKVTPIQLVSRMDEEEDTQPFLHVSPEGEVFIVWVSSDAQDSNIFFSRLHEGNWTREYQINIPNQVPDIDPTICSTEKGLVIVWSGFQKERYLIKASHTVLKLFTLVQQMDLSDYLPNKVKSFPSTVREGNTISLFFFSGLNLHKARLHASDMTAIEKPGPVTVDSHVNDALLKLPLHTMLSLMISYKNSQGFSCSINLGLYMEKLKYGAAVKNNAHSEAFELTDRTEKITLAFGDMITKGYGSKSGGYPGRLGRILSRIIINQGVHGETTDSGLGRIKSVLSTIQPEKTLIMEGTMDINLGRSIYSISFNLQEMIIQSLKYNANPVLATLPPNQFYSDRTLSVNKEILYLSHKTGFPCVDMDKLFEGKDHIMFFQDPIHPNKKGYEMIAYGFYFSLYPPSDKN